MCNIKIYRCRFSRFSALCTLMFYSMNSSMAVAGDCASVYVNSTRTISQSYRQVTELGYSFNLYCSKSGEVNNAAVGANVEAVVKQIPFNFSATSTTAQSKMEEFCKIGVQQNYFNSQAADYKSEVVVAALNSFNPSGFNSPWLATKGI